MEAPKEYGKISIGLENRVIPEDKLENTPSRKHGVSEELERDLRVVGCEYIQSAGLLLKLPQVNISAILFFHYRTLGLLFTGCHGHCPGVVSKILLL